MIILSSSLENTLKIEDFPMVLRCLLDRIPIIIFGSDKNDLDTFAVNLIKFTPHRQELVFWSDFATVEEYDRIRDEESQDFDTPRVIIRSPALAAKQALNNFNNFKGWIFSISADVIDLDSCIDTILNKEKNVLVIDLDNGSEVNYITNNKRGDKLE
ncbi:MAG: hypothetical protein ACTSYQ_03215, partial [Candidatus Odinarchaeia archaeon]